MGSDDGQLYFTNGDYFEGRIMPVEPYEPITGKMIYSNGHIFIGPFEGGRPEGQGKLIYDNESFYEGGFVSGAPKGVGARTSKDGTRFVGNFPMKVVKKSS